MTTYSRMYLRYGRNLLPEMQVWKWLWNAQGPSRAMHVKQAIRPAILPKGLPAKTVSLGNIRRQMRLDPFMDENTTFSLEEILEGRELTPMKSIFSEIDYKVVRKRLNLLYYHRLSLLVQRVNYLSTVNITKREKYLSIKSTPPALIISWGPDDDVSYLRGMVSASTEPIYILYPLFFQISYFKSVVEQKADYVAKELGITREKVLRFLFDIPCFMLNHKHLEQTGTKLILVHKFLVPDTFSLDSHTAKLYPPIFNNKVLKQYRDITNGKSSPRARDFCLKEILDFRYPSCHGSGTLEDLSKFLKDARNEESYQLRSKGVNKKIAHHFEL